MARNWNKDAQPFLTDSIKSFAPWTLRKVHCCLANEAVGKYSDVAEFLTVTANGFLFF